MVQYMYNRTYHMSITIDIKEATYNQLSLVCCITYFVCSNGVPPASQFYVIYYPFEYHVPSDVY